MSDEVGTAPEVGKNYANMTSYEAVIGLEIHAELQTRSKMFCSCPVVDLTTAPPNSAVCPVCSGMPGVLPVINRQAVTYALRVALALDCTIHPTSIFARKNYFYPDLPKGYQISQYEHPLATDGQITIFTGQGEHRVRIRRVHLEEDTGKSTHIQEVVPDQPVENGAETAGGRQDQETNHSTRPSHSLVDLNRSGIGLLEIVTEPDMHSAAEVGATARAIRRLLRYLEVNSGDMEKGVLRIEPNVSVRPAGSKTLGTRTEVKNLNSFRALERAVAFEIDRQVAVLEAGNTVMQETVGWDEKQQVTLSQRSKEEAHDYRYFPEPDLPPLEIDSSWLESVRVDLPETPTSRRNRFVSEYQLSPYDARVLTSERKVADFFEATLAEKTPLAPKNVANWITGEVFGHLNQAATPIEQLSLTPADLAGLLDLLRRDEINQATAKKILGEMLAGGGSPAEIIQAKGWGQISDEGSIEEWVQSVLKDHPDQVEAYLGGKENISNWLFGQVMRRAGGKANPDGGQRTIAGGPIAVEGGINAAKSVGRNPALWAGIFCRSGRIRRV